MSLAELNASIFVRLWCLVSLSSEVNCSPCISNVFAASDLPEFVCRGGGEGGEGVGAE